MRKFIFAFLLSVLLIGSASALGVSPGRSTVDFYPGFSQDFTVAIVNSDRQDLNLVISPQGELRDYITVRETLVQMSADEASRDVSFSISLPQTLPPGLHTADVVIVQLPNQFLSTGETSVGAAVAVLTQVHVNVPYPGKFGEVDLNVLSGETIKFVSTVESKGEFALTHVKGEVVIRSALGEEVARVATQEIPEIAGKTRQELVAEIDSSQLPQGRYIAEITVSWGDGVATAEKEFSVGQKRLRVEGVEVPDFELGDIAKFEITVASQWSEAIDDVYAEIVVFDAQKNILATFKSPTATVSSGGKEKLLAFWDTKGVNEATYDAELRLKYTGGEDILDLTFEVAEDKITIYGAGFIIASVVSGTSSGLFYFLVCTIIVLALANLSWFVYLRKKLRKK